MNHTEKLTRYVGNFVDELVCSGLEHVVISPGSRSTPLAMMMREHEEIKEHIVVDERGAAFFALGMAK
ncbi:MAG TPA: thiamine pyrophosphate-binding protein, partial [Pseudogracilibacillus sp.]|nr:thiamine pyrophosphate-binding protein [Pseudogracilibacillus sp.]